ncbi:MAG: hypothetical protein A3G18_05185 [Rhodospirillales bacterium RIFCSPLOWO2_12_FULL_58_28]|nr:MAG: hypothetical protein A3H92_05280 [Rhodospirillales bacterium RIFCSPLOWO2_02_FULL_58_16]OHC78302.1 MAG: hypothetical protein A3G18_05185 [Rhodospirillales bacterium RIFCSPLOWO2_12_FULL_58_28]
MGGEQKSATDALREEVERQKKALEQNPGNIGLYVSTGDMLRKLGDTQDAKRHYEAATLNDPACVDAWIKLGHVLLRECNFTGALANYAMAQAYQPRDMMRLWMALTMPPVFFSQGQINAFRRRVERGLDVMSQAGLVIDDPSDLAAMLFYMAYHGLPDRKFHDKLADLHLKACPSLGFVAPHIDNPRPRKDEPRIKVGFISRFFFEHSIGRLMQGVIAKLDRRRFHVTLVVIPHVEDEMTNAIAAGADKTIRAPLNLDVARRAIAREMLDVIVYPEIGMDSFSYCLAFARLAPVQCVTWGHPVSPGIPNLDYFVSSEALETEGGEKHYRETLFRLKALPTYYYKPKVSERPKSRADFGLAEDINYYLFAQYLFRMHPGFDGVMADILRRDPKGNILLVRHPEKSWSNLLTARFKESIPDVVERIKFAPFMEHGDFLALMACVDVCLDPPTFSGGNTTIEALTVGTPVVTMPGEMMRTRVCAAICRQIGLTDCIVKTPSEYVDIAVRLGVDKAFQKKTREYILKHNHALFENDEAVREWERFFLTACEAKDIRPPD